MAQWPSPSEWRLKSWDQLLNETLLLYRQAFVPLVATTAIGALLTNLLLAAWLPDTLLPVMLWLVVASVPSFIAQAAATVIASRVHRGESAKISLAYAVAMGVAPTFVVGSALVLVITQLSIYSIVGIPLGLFLATRWSLFGPAVVLEQRGVGESLIRSWRLVTGKNWRTFFIVIVAGIGALAVLLISRSLAAILGNTLVAEVLIFSAVFSVSVPVGTTYFLLLFDDYRLLEGGGDRELPP